MCYVIAPVVLLQEEGLMYTKHNKCVELGNYFFKGH